MDVPVKTIKAIHKIDMWCTIIVLGQIITFMTMASPLVNPVVLLHVPTDLIAHYFISPNPNLTERFSTKAVICNPHFKTYFDNYRPAGGDGELTSVRSDEFLALPNVSNYVKTIELGWNTSRVIYGITVRQICETRPLVYDVLPGCMTFDDIVTECLGGSCGENPNLCWWGNARFITLLGVGQLIFYYIGIAQTVLLIYDPPPARIRKVVSPWIAAFVFLISSFCSLLAVILELAGVAQHAHAPSFYSEFTDYWVEPGAVPVIVSFACLASGVSGGIFLYLAIFAPKYPRQKVRWDLRRSNFELSMKNIREKASKN